MNLIYESQAILCWRCLDLSIIPQKVIPNNAKRVSRKVSTLTQEDLVGVALIDPPTLSLTTDPLTYSLNYPPTHSPTHFLPYSLIHLLTHFLMVLTHSLTHSSLQSVNHSLSDQLIDRLID